MKHDDPRQKWREQIERGWMRAQYGQVVDGRKVMATIKARLKARMNKRACS